MKRSKVLGIIRNALVSTSKESLNKDAEDLLAELEKIGMLPPKTMIQIGYDKKDIFQEQNKWESEYED